MNINKVIKPEPKITTKSLVKIAMLSAIAVVLMFFEMPLWFIPGFYKIDLSELPVLVGAFSMGPLAGAIIEVIKILLNLLIKGTNTAGVGDLANLVIGCSLVIPAAIIYKKNKTRKSAIIGLAIGTIIMAIVSGLFNAFVLLPLYAKAMMPMQTLISMGTKVNHNITSLTTFILYAVVPFNIIKGGIVSIITVILYKFISPVLEKR